ncbi:MAG: nitrilase-related carbon-nitrogen hydrolase [Xanthomonadales bacterium]|nr:nitrilase-related carbon-nitrogen hydrolase [Xanthomonadales bacterium]
MDRFYAAACQTDFPAPVHRREIGDRVRRMCDMARNAVEGYRPFFDVRLLSFPEFAHAVPIHDNPRALIDHLAVELPNEHTDRYQDLCRELGIYIQTGTFLEMDPGYPEAVFNTTLLIGPDGIISRYRKVNTWIPWEVHTSPHDLADYDEPLFPVADTPIGKIGVAICYDWLFPETIRQLAFDGAEIVVRVSAYMDPWGGTRPMDWWTLFNRARAAENTVYVVASNQAAEMRNYPPFSWPGSSMVVDYDGRILAQAEPGTGEAVVVAPIDLAALRAERERRQGHDMRAHTRSEAYDYLSRPRLSSRGTEPVGIDELQGRIRDSKNRLL